MAHYKPAEKDMRLLCSRREGLESMCVGLGFSLFLRLRDGEFSGPSRISFFRVG